MTALCQQTPAVLPQILPLSGCSLLTSAAALRLNKSSHLQIHHLCAYPEIFSQSFWL